MSRLLAKISAIVMAFFTFIAMPFVILGVSEAEKSNLKANGLIIGAKAFPEGNILGNIEHQMINHWTDIYTELVTGIRGGVVPEIFESGNIDTIAEYSGSIYDNYWRVPPKGFTSQQVSNFDLSEYQKYMEDYAKTKKLEIIVGDGKGPDEGLGFEDKYAIAVRSNSSLSYATELRELFFGSSGTIGAASDVFNKSGIFNRISMILEKTPLNGDTNKNNAEAYFKSKNWNFSISDITSNKYTALKNGNIDAALVYTTDGALNERDAHGNRIFKVLNLPDMNSNFPGYQTAFVISKNKLNRFSSIKLKRIGRKSNSSISSLGEVLSAVKISALEMIEMNSKFNSKGGQAIATEFLKSKNYFEDNI